MINPIAKKERRNNSAPRPRTTAHSCNGELDKRVVDFDCTSCLRCSDSRNKLPVAAKQKSVAIRVLVYVQSFRRETRGGLPIFPTVMVPSVPQRPVGISFYFVNRSRRLLRQGLTNVLCEKIILRNPDTRKQTHFVLSALRGLRRGVGVRLSVSPRKLSARVSISYPGSIACHRTSKDDQLRIGTADPPSTLSERVTGRDSGKTKLLRALSR